MAAVGKKLRESGAHVQVPRALPRVFRLWNTPFQREAFAVGHDTRDKSERKRRRPSDGYARQ